MKHYKNILFDLDGTITDSGKGILNAVVYALDKYNITVSDFSEVTCFIGPPLTDSFQHYYGFSEEKAIQAVGYFREYYADKGIFENTLFEGIRELLAELSDQGKQVILATSKPEVYAKIILEHFQLTPYFKYIAGSNLDGSRVRKAAVIRYALDASNISDLSSVIMIGDREHDINGAQQVGIPSIGVLFGYGDHEELHSAGADYIVEDVASLSKLLLHKA